MYNNVTTTKTNYWNIHIAGDIQTAREFTREYTFQQGWCVQLTPCEYIYTGGLEAGMIARVISYPRFEKKFEVLDGEVKAYAEKLAYKLCQKSYTIERNDLTMYYESANTLHKK